MLVIVSLIASCIGAGLGVCLVDILIKKRMMVRSEPGTGTMKEHIYIEPLKQKKTVFRDKEIEAEDKHG